MAKVLTKLRIDEVSGVDRGAGEGVTIMLMKRDEDVVVKPKRSRLAKAWDALTGRDDATPLIKAVDASAHAKPVADILATAEAALRKSIESILADATVTDKAAEIGKTVDQYTEHLRDTVPAGVEDAVRAGALAAAGYVITEQGSISKGTDMTSTSTASPEVETLKAELAKLTNELAITKMSDVHKVYADKASMTDEQKSAFAAKTADERDAQMASAPIDKALPAEVQKQLDEAVALKKRVADLEERDALAGFTKRAVEIGLPEADGVTLMKASKGDAEAVKKLEDAIKALSAQVKEAGLFKELGTAQGGDATSPVAQVDAVVAEMQKAEPTLSRQQAVAKIAKLPQHAAIWKAYKEATTPARAA